MIPYPQDDKTKYTTFLQELVALWSFYWLSTQEITDDSTNIPKTLSSVCYI